MNTRKIYSSEEDANKAYTDFLNNHIRTVIEVWERFKILPMLYKEFKFISFVETEIDVAIYTHDQDKFEPNMFKAYRNYFYPITDNNKKENKIIYTQAYDKHACNNAHHIKFHYTLQEKEIGHRLNLNIPLVNCIEIVCDWIARSIEINNDIISYWNESKSRCTFNPSTWSTIDKLYSIYTGKLI